MQDCSPKRRVYLYTTPGVRRWYWQSWLYYHGRSCQRFSLHISPGHGSAYSSREPRHLMCLMIARRRPGGAF